MKIMAFRFVWRPTCLSLQQASCRCFCPVTSDCSCTRQAPRKENVCKCVSSPLAKGKGDDTGAALALAFGFAFRFRSHLTNSSPEATAGCRKYVPLPFPSALVSLHPDMFIRAAAVFTSTEPQIINGCAEIRTDYIVWNCKLKACKNWEDNGTSTTKKKRWRCSMLNVLPSDSKV